MPRHVLIKPVAPLLADRGYREIRSTGIHVRELTPGIEAWIGLNTGRRLGGLVVNPNLGVRHTQVMRLVSVLRGDRPLGAAAPPTVLVSLLSLLPKPWRDSPQWEVRHKEDADNARTWDTFARELDEYGQPWMQERSTPQSLVEPLRRGEGWEQSRLALPVLLWTLGDLEGAAAALTEGRSMGRVGGMEVDYDGFADRLLTEMADHPDGPTA